MKITGRIAGASVDFASGKSILTLEVNEKNDFKLLVDEMRGKDKLSIEVKLWRAKRSLDANAYFFVLADKLAEKLGTSKIEVYRECIKNIGGNSTVVCVKNSAVERLCSSWQANGLGWCYETTQSKIEGCTNVILYYGSSTYDTAQMSRLIDNVVQECKEQGIETMPPQELERLVQMWGGK